MIPWPGLPRAPSTLTLIAHALLPESVHAQPELEHYLVEHQGQATYLVATINASTAAPFILDTGKAVMAIGGFNGFDAILTAQQVAALVARGTVRFFLLPSFAPDLLTTVPAEYRSSLRGVSASAAGQSGSVAAPHSAGNYPVGQRSLPGGPTQHRGAGAGRSRDDGGSGGNGDLPDAIIRLLSTLPRLRKDFVGACRRGSFFAGRHRRDQVDRGPPLRRRYSAAC